MTCAYIAFTARGLALAQQLKKRRQNSTLN